MFYFEPIARYSNALFMYCCIIDFTSVLLFSGLILTYRYSCLDVLHKPGRKTYIVPHVVGDKMSGDGKC